MRTVRGKIGYFHTDAGDTGREWFAITVMPDGTRTLRAHCEMDDHGVLRDVTYTVDRDWRPLDAFIRITVRDRFVGSSWFRFTGRGVECEGVTALEGRVSQFVALAHPAARFGTHSLITDGWHAALWDPRGTAAQSIRCQPASSHAANGATGPLVLLGDSTLEYLGTEIVTVPAGRFPCTHFQIFLVDYPALHFWVTGPDLILVRMEWNHLNAYYELLELEHARSNRD